MSKQCIRGFVSLSLVLLVGCGGEGSPPGSHSDAATVDGSFDSSMPQDSSAPWDGSSPDAALADAAAAADGSVDAGAPPPPGADASPPGSDAGPDASLDGGDDLCLLRETMEPLVLHLSADDSNSMASPVIARSMLLSGARPTASILRTYEFLNYYNVAYPTPAQGRATAAVELRAGASEHEWTLQLGVQSAPMPEAPRGRVLTLVLDTSGSMTGAPMDLEREVVRNIAASLEAGDIVSFVEWNSSRTVPLEALVVDGPNDARLLAAADALEAGGGTDLHGGLRFGYALARAHYDETKLNRVVLVSDGRANAGVTDIETIADAARDEESAGIYLVGVGVGDGFNDTLMNDVTDAGRGAYVFVSDEAEAARMFVDRFDEVMEVALLDVRVQLTLPWYLSVREFHGEEISTVAKEVTPQHLAPGDAMVFHQVIAACDATVVDLDDDIAMTTRYVEATTRVFGEETTSATMAELLVAPDVGLTRGDAIVAYAEALADAPTLPGAEARAMVDEAIATVEAANTERTDPALNEILDLLSRFRDLLR